MARINFTVPPEDDGATVRHILRARLHFSSHAISRLTRVENGILLNGQCAHTPFKVHTGDILSADVSDHRPPPPIVTPGDWPLPVVYEDDHLLAVNKPAGMTAHASNFLPDTPTVAGALAYARGTDFIFHSVNRLDKGTTGLMLVAKSGYIHDRLRKSLHSDAFIRRYLAVCEGVPSPAEGTIDAPIARDPASAIARCVAPDGQSSRTEYRVLKTLCGSRALLLLRPLTGRTHQIRVHCAYIGHPLTGDWLYGKEQKELIARPALHSFDLTLRHPVYGDTLHLTAPPPEDFMKLLRDTPII